jgi:hypothetical protein
VGASVVLVNPNVATEPGHSVVVDLRLKNTGTVVDEFTLDVLGDAAGWAVVDPPTLSLFPGAEGTAKAVFSPPRAATTPAGQVAFGLRARSKEDPAGSAVEEGTVEVGAYLEPFAELVPRTSRGSGSASHELAVDNRGNARLSAEIEATDADRQLRFDVRPPAVVVEPGMASFAKIKVSPAKRFWRGQPKTRPFQLYVRPAGGTPIALDGTMVQESVLPPWFMKALLALLVAAILLVVLWLGLVKPTIQSAAGDAVASPIASLKNDVNQALQNAGMPTMPASSAGSGGGGGGASPSPQASAAPSGATSSAAPTATPGVFIAGLGAPVDGRLDKTTTTVAPKTTLFITDLVFSNPNGVAGALVIERSGVTLLQLRLDNFRDYDLHFVTPIVITPGQQLQLSLTCTPASPCDPAVFYSGYQRP